MVAPNPPPPCVHILSLLCDTEVSCRGYSQVVGRLEKMRELFITSPLSCCLHVGWKTRPVNKFFRVPRVGRSFFKPPVLITLEEVSIVDPGPAKGCINIAPHLPPHRAELALQTPS